MVEAARSARLSKRSVDAAEAEDVRYIVWDKELKGFGLRVEPSGTKTYICRYRAGGGRRGTLRQFKIGTHGKLTPDQARDAAAGVLAKAELGQDPQAVKTAYREGLTIAELCDLYLAEGVSSKKESTLKLDRIRIARHIKPRLGTMKVAEVDRGDIERLMQDVGSGKIRGEATPHTRGGKGAASRTVGLLSGIFTFAVARKLRSDNPAKGIKRFADGRRERFLSPKELAKLGEVLAQAEVRGARPGHIAILRLLALTGTRKNEIARLRWAEVDAEGGYLRLDDSKTGRKVVPLGAPALTILAETPRAGDWVFPDPKHPNEPIRGLDWAWVGIRNEAGMPELRIHDLRHSFASVALAGGSGLHLIGKLLGHADTSSTQRYAHLADDPLKAAADRVAQTISVTMTPPTLRLAISNGE